MRRVFALLAIIAALAVISPAQQVLPAIGSTWQGSGGGGASLVLDSATTCGASFVSSFTCAATNAIPVGHRAIAIVYSNQVMSTFLTSVTDPGSNSWTCIDNDLENSSGYDIAICNAVVTTQINASANITFNLANSSNGAGAIIYDANSHTGTNAADTSGTANGAVTSATVTTGASLSATDFVFAALIIDKTATVGTLSSGYTALQTNLTVQNGYNFALWTAWKSQASGATASVTASVSPSSNSASTIVAYQQ